MTSYMQVILIALGLFAVRGIDSLDQCSQGSSVWCENFLTARNCGQLDFCKQVVWAKPVENDEVCALCKDAIEAMGQYIGKHDTKQKVEAALTQLCKDVPIDVLSQKCLQVISQDFDLLYDEIVTLIENGDLVCGLLGLCKTSVTEDVVLNHLVNRLPAMVKEAMANNQLPVAAPVLIMDHQQDCNDCEAFIHDIQNAIKNNDALVNEWKQLVKKECDALGPGLSEICHDETAEAISSLVDTVFNNHDAMTVCKAINMCGFTSIKEANDPCTDCKNFFTDFEEKIKNNNSVIDELSQKIMDACQGAGEFATVDDFVNGLSKFYCLQEPSYLQSKCAKYVAMVIRTCINRMIVETPDEICQAIDFCEESVTSHASKNTQLIESGDPCKDCTTFMTDLQGVAKNNQTIVSDLTDLVKGQCDQLGPGLSELCEHQVVEAVPNLLSQFERDNVGTICTSIMMCSSPPTEPPKGGDLCNDCIAFTEDWQHIIQNNQSIIDNFLDKTAESYCNHLPFFLKDKCDEIAAKTIQRGINYVKENCATFVKDYLPYLWNLIAYNDAETICSTIYMCDAIQHQLLVNEVLEITSLMKKDGQVSDNGEVCEICKIVIAEVDRMLEKNATEADVVAALEKVCDLYSSDIRAECKMFVKEYGSDIVDLLVNEISPDQVCSKLSLCATQLTVRDSIPCELCETVAEALDDLLEKNSTEAEIIAAVDKVCSILPGEFRDQCNTLIQQYGDAIIQLLVNMIDPQKLCSELGLCATSLVQLPNAASHTECLICQMVISDAEVFIFDYQDETVIIEALLKACDAFPASMQAGCKQFVSQNADQLLRFITAVFPPEIICLKIKVCSLQSVALKFDNVLCPACEMLASELEKSVSSNSTQAEIENEVRKVCKSLPSGLRPLCDMVIQLYEPKIVNALMKNVPPKKLCSFIGICSANLLALEANDPCKDCTTFMTDLQGVAKNNQSIVNDLTDLVKGQCDQLGPGLSELCKAQVSVAAPNVVGMLEVADVGTICTTIMMCSSPPTEPPKGGDLCNDCIAFTEDWQNIIQNNKSIIDNLLDTAAKGYCNQLPTFLAGQCDEVAAQSITKLINYVQETCATFVKDYLPYLWNLIAYNDAETICSTAYMCDAAEKKELVQVQPELAEKNPIVCEACQAVASVLDRVLEENSTKEDIIDAVEKVCTLVPSQFQTSCDDIVKEYGETVIQLLLNAVKPDQLCVDLKLCPGSLSCKLCETVTQALGGLLGSNSTEEEIIQAVKKVCSILPSQYRSECDDLIEQYGKTIIQKLINNVPPREICSSIGLCAPNTKITARLSRPVSCVLCKMVIQEVDKMIQGNRTAAAIKHALDKVCSEVPNEYARECKKFVHKYGSTVVDLMINEVDTSVICSQLVICAVPLPIQQENSVSCELCETVAQALDDMLESNSTEEEIIQAVEKVCSILPSQFRSECDDLIEQYGKTIIQMLINDESPQKICSSIGLCASNFKITARVSNPVSCVLCKLVVHEVDKKIQGNRTAAAILHALDTVCAAVPGKYAKECKDFVDEYGPTVVDLVINEVESGVICNRLLLCAVPLPIQQERLSSPVSCVLCKMVIQEVDKMIQGNRTAAAIKHALDKVCSEVPNEYAKACKDFVDIYGSVVVDLMINEADTSVICSQLVICPAFPPIQQENSVSCELCETVAQALDDMLESNSTEEEIIQAVEKVCSILPSQFRSECDDLIEQYGKTIIQMLINDVSPQKICSSIGLCASNFKITARVSNPVSCLLCKLVIHEVDKKIQGNRTAAAILHALDTVCAAVPGKYAKECKNFVDEYGPTIVDLVINEVESGVICNRLLLCVVPLPIQQEANSETCDLCVVIATELDNLITENSTEAEIKHAVEKVCSLVPSQYSSLCDMLIEEYGSKIIEELINEVSPQKLCSTVGLCSTSNSVAMLADASHSECLVCQMLVTNLEVLVFDFQDETMIIEEIRKICNVFPGELQAICLQFIDQNAGQLLHFVAEVYPPEYLCSKINVCKISSDRKSFSGLCPLCQIVAEELDKLITTNSTQGEFEEALDKVCAVLPGDLSQECDDFIKSVAPAILELLAKEVSPSQLCSELKLCAAKSVTFAVDESEMMMKQNLTSQNQLGWGNQQRLQANGELCNPCKSVIGLLDNMLERNVTRHAIELGLKSVCNLAPIEIKDFCDDFVDQYTPAILNLAEHIFDPAYICLHLGLCGESRHLVGTDHCTYGPAYWCQNEHTAAECQATEHCRLHVWN